MKKVRLSKDFHTVNRKNLISMLPEGSLVVFHSSDVYYRNGDQPFPFRQQSDFFYLTGIDQENSILLIYPDCPNPELREVCFLQEPTEASQTWEGYKLSKKEATEVSGIDKVKWIAQFDVILQELMSFAENVFLNANEYAKFFSDVPYRDIRFAKGVREKFPNHNYRRVAPLIYNLRKIKSNEEINMIREAAKLTGKAFQRVLKFTKPGVTEYQLEAEITHEFLFEGVAGHAYHPIIASGSKACILHYIENSEPCSDGDLILMDFGAEYGHYAADLSRTIPVNGRFNARQRQCYEAVLRVLRQAPKLLIPGKTIDQVNKQVNRLMEQEMIGLGLFTPEDVAGQDPEKPLFTKYFMHGVTHFLGLDVHDVGSKFEPLQPGMVMTFEPGLYIKEEGIGIRLENNFLVTEKEAVNLTEGIPVEIADIENIMLGD